MRDQIGIADEEKRAQGVRGSLLSRVIVVAITATCFVAALLMGYAGSLALQPRLGHFVDGPTRLQPSLGLSLIEFRQAPWPSLGLLFIEPRKAPQQFSFDRARILLRSGVPWQADRQRRGLRYVRPLGREPHASARQRRARD